MRNFLNLIAKDLTLELRSKQVLAVMSSTSLLIAIIAAAGCNVIGLPPNTITRLFPMLVWLTFVFSATLSFGKGHDYETDEQALEGLLTSGISPALLYAAKLIGNIVIFLILQLVSFFVLSILLDVAIVQIFMPFALLSLGVVTAYGALATMLVALSSGSQLRHLLLPLVLLPLIIPLFFAALELTATLCERGTIDLASPWVSLLLALDVVYFLAGLNLYEYALKD